MLPRSGVGTLLFQNSAHSPVDIASQISGATINHSISVKFHLVYLMHWRTRELLVSSLLSIQLCSRVRHPSGCVQVHSQEDILSAKKLLFPGVGSYGQAMNELVKQGYVEALTEYIQVPQPTHTAMDGQSR